MRNKIIAGLVLAPLTALALTACGTEQEAKVTKPAMEGASASAAADDVVKDEATDESGVVVDEAATDTETQKTAALGDTVKVGDWSVKVTEVALNANKALANPNYMNEKPKGQFVLVTYEATYTGPERTADAQSDLTWSLTTNDNKIWDTDYQTTPADDQEWSYEARKGGTVKQQVMFDVNPKTLPKSILSVEGYNDFGDTVFADFKV